MWIQELEDYIVVLTGIDSSDILPDLPDHQIGLARTIR